MAKGLKKDALEAAQGAELLAEAMTSFRVTPRQQQAEAEARAVNSVRAELMGLTDASDCKYAMRDMFEQSEDKRRLVLDVLGDSEWRWESQDPKSSAWVMYTVADSQKLDAAHAHGDKRCELSIGGAPFSVDFKAGQQYNKRKAARPVRRRRFADFGEFVGSPDLFIPFINDSDEEGGREREDGVIPMEDGKRLLDALVHACGPSLEEMHYVVCALVRNNMLSMAQHLTSGRLDVLNFRSSLELPPLHHAVRNFARGAIIWLVSVGQDVKERAHADLGGDSVLSYAKDCSSGSDEWLLREYPECADVVDPPPKHVAAVNELRQQAAKRAAAGP